MCLELHTENKIISVLTNGRRYVTNEAYIAIMYHHEKKK